MAWGLWRILPISTIHQNAILRSINLKDCRHWIWKILSNSTSPYLKPGIPPPQRKPTLFPGCGWLLFVLVETSLSGGNLWVQPSRSRVASAGRFVFRGSESGGKWNSWFIATTLETSGTVPGFPKQDACGGWRWMVTTAGRKHLRLLRVTVYSRGVFF